MKHPITGVEIHPDADKDIKVDLGALGPNQLAAEAEDYYAREPWMVFGPWTLWFSDAGKAPSREHVLALRGGLEILNTIAPEPLEERDLSEVPEIKPDLRLEVELLRESLDKCVRAAAEFGQSGDECNGPHLADCIREIGRQRNAARDLEKVLLARVADRDQQILDRDRAFTETANKALKARADAEETAATALRDRDDALGDLDTARKRAARAELLLTEAQAGRDRALKARTDAEETAATALRDRDDLVRERDEALGAIKAERDVVLKVQERANTIIGRMTEGAPGAEIWRLVTQLRDLAEDGS